MSKTLPVIAAAAGALLLMGGKKSRKPKSRRICTTINSYEQFLEHVDTKEYVLFPMALVLHPPGEDARGKDLCESLASAGARTVVSSATHMVQWVMDIYDQMISDIVKQGGDPSAHSPPGTYEDILIEAGGVAVIKKGGQEAFVEWKDIPWDNIPSLLA